MAIYGQADVTFGGTAIPAIAERVVFRAEPIFDDLRHTYEFGDSPVDKAIRGWNVTVELAFQEDDLAAVKMAIPHVMDGTTALKDIGVGKTLTSLSLAKELLIKPRAYADGSRDITVYNAVPTGTFERVYGLEQGQIAVTFTALPKEGSTGASDGNFFLYGKTGGV